MSNTRVLTWLWHDAAIYYLKTVWDVDGDMWVVLRSDINPEEDRRALIAIGIEESVIDVQFRGVWRFQTDLQGAYAHREVIDDWDIVTPSPLIEELRRHLGPLRVDLVHHSIRCSGGSAIDIVFEQCWLEKVAQSPIQRGPMP